METYFSLIVTGQDGAGQTSSVVLGWTKVTTENRDGLVGRIPRRPSNNNSNNSLTEAVLLAHQVRDFFILSVAIFKRHYYLANVPYHQSVLVGCCLAPCALAFGILIIFCRHRDPPPHHHHHLSQLLSPPFRLLSQLLMDSLV